MLHIQANHAILSVFLSAALLLQTGPAYSSAVMQDRSSSAYEGFYRQPTNQIIVKYKNSGGEKRAPGKLSNSDQAKRLSDAGGAQLTYRREMADGAQVLRLAAPLALDQVQAIAGRIMALPEVEYAEPDAIKYPTTAPPNDPLYPNQWHYQAPGSDHYGINAPAAWDVTTGAPGIVVGVIDTGITHHADLAGRTAPGRDFISDVYVANDGDGRDADPSDPGDWVAANECYQGNPPEGSSWHGTHTAGTIGAASNNGLGVTGINWNSKILPVRVLGRCGGYDSDIVDGMEWAAGLSVPGEPANPNPAKVLNVSLGGESPCSNTFQTAINAITAHGATMVVAAGNSNMDASGFEPANCAGVITVGATDRYGSRAYYSNYGAMVEISAPGGEQSYANDPNGIYSTLNTGTTAPVADTYAYYQGTSMATPHVAGIVSLMYSLNPALTPAQILSDLQASATTFPAGSGCNPGICGSGIANAGAAIALVQSRGTTTAITAHAPDPSIMGETVSVQYSVTPLSGSGVPSGTVTVGDGVVSCSGLVSAGQCSLALTSPGTRILTATYSGDANFDSSTSAGVAHSVWLNLLRDPGFEGYPASTPWAQGSTNFATPLCIPGNSPCSGQARTGNAWAKFGRTTADEIGYVQQSVLIPRGTAKLKLYLWIDRADTGSDTNDIFRAKIDATTVFSANATQAGTYPDYTPVSLDVSQFADGKTHVVRFESNTTGQIVNFDLDDVSLEVPAFSAYLPLVRR
ncbi:MAG TPA: S8 family serine peptidase [Anaerolineaceae bacterium]|nr:S8 family serine peptidase [Anaerolineaceae bacterium]